MKPTILNVDDTEIARYAKRRTLEHAGFEVIDAATGSDALAKMAAFEFKLVLLDVRLPDINGIEVCKSIKKRWPTTMVLQTSATFVTAADRARGLQGGADGYLIQPIDADELVASVRALMRLHDAEESTRSLNALLEQRIAERTLELHESNRQLHEANRKLKEEMEQRVNAEAALVQAQKMEAVGQLSGTMAHDFNNILASMTGYIHLVRRLSNVADHQTMLDKALATAERGKRLTSRLLAFARGSELVTGPVNVGELVKSMHEWLSQSVGSQVTVTVEVAAGRLLATTDASQLELAVLNLVINARDAMPQGGVVGISVGPQDLMRADHELAAGPYVVVTVRDSGTGMTPDVGRRAFEPFFTTKPAGRGTGLGLTQVRTLAQLSRGGARLKSSPDGTTIEIWLAGTAVEPGRISNDSSSDSELRGLGERLLVVDDEPDIRQTVAELLREQGYEVFTAASGKEALAVLAEQAIELVLLDYAMPGMTGLEVARRVRIDSPNLPVLFLTGFADRALLAQEFPSHLVLSKPFKSRDLFEAITARL